MKPVGIVVGLAALLGAAGIGQAQSVGGCALLTQAEVTSALGKPTRPGRPSIGGCQWLQVGGYDFVQTEIVDVSGYQRPEKTAKMLSGIGIEAYSDTDSDGPLVMAKTSKSMVVVWAKGDKVNPEKLVELIKLIFDRGKP